MSILQGVFLLFKLYAHTLCLDLNEAQQLGYAQSEGAFNKTVQRERDVYYDYSNKLFSAGTSDL